MRLGLTGKVDRLSVGSLLLCFALGAPRAAAAHGEPPSGAPAPAAASTAAPAPAAAPSAAPASAAPKKRTQPRATLTVPIYTEEYATIPVARVGSDVITMQELVDALASSHEDRSGTTRAKTEFLPLLERMIELRLVLLDARETGIDQSREIRDMVEAFEDGMLISLLRDELSEGIQADPEEVEQLVRHRAREWKVRSVLFESEKDAKELVAAVAAGKSFEELAKKAVEDKKGSGAPEAEYLGRDLMFPAIERLVEGLAVGAVGGPIPLKNGFAVVRVEDVRYPENPQIRAAVETESRIRREKAAVWKAYEGLQKKYLKKVDRALLARVDFHAKKPGINALLKDKRVLVAFQDPKEKPITVAEVATAVERKFFHGMELAVKEKRVNDHKENIFETALMKRVLLKEARARKLHERHEFTSRVAGYENSVVFGRFVETAIKPSVRVEEAQVKAYFEEHKAEFSDPELFTLESIAWPDARKAEAALAKLRAGADFRWMKANGEGLASEEELDQDLNGRTVTVQSMPAALAKALAGAREGEYRLYTAPGGLCYVLRVARHVPSAAIPLEKVKNEIIKKLFDENLSKAVKDWAGKVREATEVEVLISRIDY